MLILAMDTSTTAITVGLLGDGVRVGASVLDPRGHAEHLAPLVTRVLDEAGRRADDVTDVVVGTGPGPFTGLRVGMVTGLVFAHARGLAVHGVCSLDAVARDAARQLGGHGQPGGEHPGAQHPGSDELLVATDARRKEVYWARYRVEGQSVHALSDPAVDRPADLPEDVRTLPTAGRGPSLYPELFPNPVPVLDVDALTLADIAAARLAAGEPMPVEPRYLRRPDALTTVERGRQ